MPVTPRRAAPIRRTEAGAPRMAPAPAPNSDVGPRSGPLVRAGDALPTPRRAANEAPAKRTSPAASLGAPQAAA